MTDFNNTREQARALWVQALRSGDYEQTQGALCRTRDSGPGGNLTPRQAGYCCLGVACDVYQKNEGGLRLGTDDDLDDGYQTFDGEEGVLPDIVADWLGITHAGDLENNDRTSLVDMNDEGATFSEIADLIDDGQAAGLLQA